MTIATDGNFWSIIALGILMAAFIIAVAPYLFRLFLPAYTDANLPASVKELVTRYIYGTVAILIGGGITVTMLGLWWVALIYLATAGACGVVVVLRYFTADIARNKQQNQMQRDHSPDLK